MNWMRISLNGLLIKTLLLGAFAGALSVLLHDLGLWFSGVLRFPSSPAFFTGIALGGGLGFFLASSEALLNRLWHRVARIGLMGGALGALAGGLGFVLADLLYPATNGGMQASLASGGGVIQWVIVPLVLGLIAASAGFGSDFNSDRPQVNLGRMLNSFLTGLLAAFPVSFLLSQFNDVPWVFQALLAVWGALVAGMIFWWEKRMARCWLRVLNGPGEDVFFPLKSKRITLGKLESNDIPLLYYQEVFPYHCHLNWNSDHYEIIDNEEGGLVQVNYRQIREQILKPGDLIKIGSALLQYGEAS